MRTANTVKIRLMADGATAESLAERVAALLTEHARLDLVEVSRPYPCRPPRQEESRVYLTFVVREESDRRS